MLTHTFDSCIYPPQQPFPSLPPPQHPLLQPPSVQIIPSRIPKQGWCLTQILPVRSILPTLISLLIPATLSTTSRAVPCFTIVHTLKA